MIGSYVVAFVNALLALSITFGLSLSSNQIGAILGAVNAGIVLITAVKQYEDNKKSNSNPPPK